MKKIIFLLLPTVSFSCQTQLEKQGWQRIAIVSHFDTSTINKKDKQLIIVTIQREHFSDVDSADKIINRPFLVRDKSPVFVFNFFFRNSVGKIINEPFPVVRQGFESDLAYYRWESDSVCLVKVLNHGNVHTSYKLTHSGNSKILEVLNESKK